MKHDADLMVAEIEGLKAQTAELEELRAQLEEADEQLNELPKLRQDVEDLEAAVAESAAGMGKLEAELSSCRSQLADAQEQHGETEKRVQTIESEKESALEKLRAAEAAAVALESAESKVDELTAVLDETKADHALNVSKVFELTNRVATAEEEAEQAKERLRTAEAAALAGEGHAEAYNNAVADLGAAKAELHGMKERMEGLEKSHADATATLATEHKVRSQPQS